MEKSSREDEEKKLPPALRVARAQKPAGFRRAAGDVKVAPEKNWKLTQTHHSSFLQNSQRCEGWPCSLHGLRNVCQHKYTLVILRLPFSPQTLLTTSQLGMWAATMAFSTRAETHNQMHTKATTQVCCRMLKLTWRAAQLEKTAELILAPLDYKYIKQAHIHEAIQSQSAECKKKEEEKMATDHCSTSSESRASGLSLTRFCTLYIKVSLRRVCMSCSENERLQRPDEATITLCIYIHYLTVSCRSLSWRVKDVIVERVYYYKDVTAVYRSSALIGESSAISVHNDVKPTL